MPHKVLLVSGKVCHQVNEGEVTPTFRPGSVFTCGHFINKPHDPAVAAPLMLGERVICTRLNILLVLAGSPATCSASFAIARELAGPKARGAPCASQEPSAVQVLWQ